MKTTVLLGDPAFFEAYVVIIINHGQKPVVLHVMDSQWFKLKDQGVFVYSGDFYQEFWKSS
jgi:hypothetical protein